MPQEKSSKSFLKTLIAWVLFGAIAGITVLAIFTSSYGWPIYLEIFSHFQLQYLVLNLLLLCILSLTRRKFLCLGGLLCCAILVVKLVPWYLPPEHLLPKDTANFRVFIANINTQNKSYDQVISLVKQEHPDLAVFMEVNDAWVNRLNSLSDQLPYSYGQANPYSLGLVIYSRSKLLAPRVEFFGTEGNASVLAELVVNNQRFSLVATHPLPPAKPSFFHSRNKQLDLIRDYLKSVTQPVLLVGDLNLTMWSPYYRRFVSQTQLKNARKGFGILPTWPTSGTYKQIPALASLLFSIPIDHCLHSRELQTVDIRTGASTGSDHRSLIVTLCVDSSSK